MERRGRTPWRGWRSATVAARPSTGSGFIPRAAGACRCRPIRGATSVTGCRARRPMSPPRSTAWFTSLNGGAGRRCGPSRRAWTTALEPLAGGLDLGAQACHENSGRGSTRWRGLRPPRACELAVAGLTRPHAVAPHQRRPSRGLLEIVARARRKPARPVRLRLSPPPMAAVWDRNPTVAPLRRASGRGVARRGLRAPGLVPQRLDRGTVGVLSPLAPYAALEPRAGRGGRAAGRRSQGRPHSGTRRGTGATTEAVLEALRGRVFEYGSPMSRTCFSPRPSGVSAAGTCTTGCSIWRPIWPPRALRRARSMSSWPRMWSMPRRMCGRRSGARRNCSPRAACWRCSKSPRTSPGWI